MDGQPIDFTDNAFALPDGGEIQRQDDRHYTVLWPSGDQIAVKVITVSGARFLNIMPMVGRDSASADWSVRRNQIDHRQLYQSCFPRAVPHPQWRQRR
ncbi:MAG: hypothetical protein AAFV72_04285 [Cyanobacteria bacterium J06635_1]